MTKIWIMSDTHFGHDKMVEYCGRPVDFSEQIIDNWKKTVGDDDIVIHLGDICIGNDEYWHKIIADLPGRKILTRGNHDHKSYQWYASHAWWSVCDSFCFEIYGKRILFSHEPREIADNDFNIHGHFHNAGVSVNRHINISMEESNYRPILLNEKLLRKGK